MCNLTFTRSDPLLAVEVADVPGALPVAVVVMVDPDTPEAPDIVVVDAVTVNCKPANPLLVTVAVAETTDNPTSLVHSCNPMLESVARREQIVGWA
jgi:hypothetical protein